MVPLAGDVKVVENVKRIKPGEGLWKTATSAPTEFKTAVPDPVLQEVGGRVVMQNDTKLSCRAGSGGALILNTWQDERWRIGESPSTISSIGWARIILSRHAEYSCLNSGST
jgi:hypothetical protein